MTSHFDSKDTQDHAHGDGLPPPKEVYPTPSLSLKAELPVYSIDQIAEYLTDGFWEDRGGARHAFDVSSGGTLTIDITQLSNDAQTTAREALQAWTDVTGINFEETSYGHDAKIFFEEGNEGAYASASFSGDTITGSTVNVHSSWDKYGTYYRQAYIHEIGHAMGLGHGGNYNGSADYQTDAHYANESWQTTVMSYFDQTENTYTDASRLRLATPQLADIAAMQDLYGIATNTNADDTTYGDGAAGYFAHDLSDRLAVAIFDAGGIDTINLVSRIHDQRIDLRGGTYSDINGYIGNFSIAQGSIIENASTGSGNDTVIGNNANNHIESHAGNDTLTGGAGDDILDGGNGNDTVDGGDGFDVAVYDRAADDIFLNFAGNDPTVADRSEGNFFTDHLAGVEAIRLGGNDYIMSDLRDAYDAMGATGEVSLSDLDRYAPEDPPTPAEPNLVATQGDDHIVTVPDTIEVSGLRGNDTFTLASASTRVNELPGEGSDTVLIADSYDLAAMTTGVETVILTGSADIDAYGDIGANTLRGNAGNNVLDGREGDDSLIGGDGHDTFVDRSGSNTLNGGAGNDAYWVNASDTQITERENEGLDKVFTSVDFDLAEQSPYIEYLFLGGTGQISGGGNNLDNLINGNKSHNALFGRNGNDTLSGNHGDDWLEGGAGNDRLIGGTGADSFVFTGADNEDVIVDFDVDQDALIFMVESYRDDLRFSNTSQGAQVFHSGGSFVIEGIEVDNLTEDNFLFI